jgi:phenylalanyl-tRNA synthetase beta subunit
MIKVLKPKSNKITCVVTDKDLLEKTIKGHIDSISNSGMFLATDNKIMAIEVFKRILVSYIDKAITIEDNKSYILESTVDNELLRFIICKVNSEKIGKGYTIALTLQD